MGQRTYSLYGTGDTRVFGAKVGLIDLVGHVKDAGQSEQLIAEAQASNRPYFVKTHEEPSTDDPAIYIVRDGRSAIVSYWHFLNEVENFTISIEAIIEGNVYAGGWSQHFALWRPDERPDTILVRYENLCADPVREMARVSKFCGRTVAGELPTFAELHAIHPGFFRSGSDQRNLEEAKAHEHLIEEKHGWLLRKLGYVRPVHSGSGNDSAQSAV